MYKVLITTGGTGGHIFPALAVAEALRSQCDARLLFVGSQYGPEKELVQKAGIDFIGLAVRGILGRGFKSIKAMVDMGRAFYEATHIIKSFKPDVAIGFGGYAAFAPMLAAKIAKIPTAIHEQNAVVGMSNKILGLLVDRIFVSMLGTKGFSEKKCIFTGNPVRSIVADVVNKAHDFAGKRLLVVGGSQGATALNDLVLENLGYLQALNVQLWHQTGLKDYERVQKAYENLGMDSSKVMGFVENMAKAYEWSDLVLCRSGASTVAELAAAGRGAVFVPFPQATHDHQTANAKLLADFGAAKVFAQHTLKDTDIMEEVVILLQNPSALRTMGQCARAQCKIHAAHEIVQQLEYLTTQ